MALLIMYYASCDVIAGMGFNQSISVAIRSSSLTLIYYCALHYAVNIILNVTHIVVHHLLCVPQVEMNFGVHKFEPINSTLHTYITRKPVSLKSSCESRFSM